MEDGDVLVVTKLGRLGRNAMDVRATVEKLATAGVRVHCLQLGGADLTSAAGKLTMQVLCAVAEFERDLLIERTNSGIQRAKAQGVHMGRKHSLTAEQRADVQLRLSAGESVRSIAGEFKTSRQSVMRVRAAA
jgi:putative DNA-invertase from lambdoid prophage Rac